jgi:hypothetical protein
VSSESNPVESSPVLDTDAEERIKEADRLWASGDEMTAYLVLRDTLAGYRRSRATDVGGDELPPATPRLDKLQDR